MELVYPRIAMSGLHGTFSTRRLLPAVAGLVVRHTHVISNGSAANQRGASVQGRKEDPAAPFIIARDKTANYLLFASGLI